MINWLLLVFLLTMSSAFAGDPQFDPSTLMKLTLVPADANVRSVIYRLRATDPEFDYPLQFELLGDGSKSIVAIDTLPCSKYNSVCQANVVLQRPLEVGRFYDFKVKVRDTKGSSTTISCSITATNATTPRDTIFPRVPELIMVPEDAKRGTELGFVVARKNPLVTKPVYLELWGSPLFAIRQRATSPDTTEGTLFLLGPLDFEKQSMFHLTILANDPYAERTHDTRNIAGIQVVVVVKDVQDVAPVWTLAPPVTKLENTLVPGDVIVRVRAEDGDKGSPRQIRYGLVSEGNPFTPFFNVSEIDGTITLARPLEEITAISHPGVPIILTVVAEEVKTNRDEPPAESSTVQLALILGERGNQPPYFENDNYISRINENAPQGTALIFSDPYITEVNDDDMGKNGVFSLTLENNNGTFEISPNVGERKANFIIKVRDNTLLDYEERQSVNFKIIAQELGPASNLSSSVDVTVFIDDINDNSPVFTLNEYEVQLPENMTAGTRVTQVSAKDIDTGLFGKIRYTQISGYLNTSLNLDPLTGVITVATDNHGFDREKQAEYHLYVEARDEDGSGNRATIPLLIKLSDVNDVAPVFDKSIYEFILSPDLRNFTSPAIIHAIDLDSEEPNNMVRYEIIYGNYENKFALNSITGELTLVKPLMKNSRQRRDTKSESTESTTIKGNIDSRNVTLYGRNVTFGPEENNGDDNMRKARQTHHRQSNSDVFVLTARAYDLGIPHLSSTCEVRVYPPESKARTMIFVVPGKNPDRQKTEEMLAALTGGRVQVQEVYPYDGKEVGATDVTHGLSNDDKSVVIASVLYNTNSVVDVTNIQHKLNNTYATNNVVSTHETGTTLREYRAESSTLMWILVLLLIVILIALLLLILCCICEGCPLYIPGSKRTIRAKSIPEETHLVHTELHKEKGPGFENKSVQAVDWRPHATRKEAWSADIAERRTKSTHWQFNRRNQKNNKDTVSLYMNGYENGSLKEIRTHDDKATMRLRDGPNIIYSKEWQKKNRHLDRDIYLEDMNNDYASINKLQQMDTKHPNHIDDLDAESLKRHEIERGSDTEYRNSLRRSFQRQRAHMDDDEQAINVGRDQFFIRDGNTEILRLVTRGRAEEISQALNNQQQQGGPVTLLTTSQPQYIMLDGGKEILMRRFIDQQHVLHPNQVQQEFAQRTAMNADAQRSGAPSVIMQNELRQQSEIQAEMASNLNNQKDNESGTIVTNTPAQSHTRRNTSSRGYIHQELLESSLRQQNELLRQILLEKEKLQEKQDAILRHEIKLETQSLPGQSAMSTQTDCNAETQTDLNDLRPARRKTRSDNDDSLSEDDDYDIYIIGNGDDNLRWVKRKRHKRRKSKDHRSKRIARLVGDIQRKIKTPIIEESESPIETQEKQVPSHKVDNYKKNYGETRTSLLRRKKNEQQTAKDDKERLKQEEEKRERSALRKEVLIEISGSLAPNISVDRHKLTKLKKQDAMLEYYDSDQESNDGDIYTTKVGRFREVFSDDSLDSIGQMETDRSEHQQPLKKDKRNLIFSRQGSSTEAKETSEYETKSVGHLSPATDDAHIRKSASEQIIRKAVDLDIKKSSTTPSMKPKKSPNAKKKVEDKKLDVSKSTPRYMQWYKNKKERDKNVPDPDDKSSSRVKKEPAKSSKKNDETKKPKIPETKETVEKGKPTKMPAPTKEEIEQAKQTALLKEQMQQNVSVSTEAPGSVGRPLLQHSEHRYEHTYPHPPVQYAQPAQIPQHLYQQPIHLLNGQTVYTYPMPQPQVFTDQIAHFANIEQLNNIREQNLQQNGMHPTQQPIKNGNVDLSSNKLKPKDIDSAQSSQEVPENDTKQSGEPLLKIAGLEDENDSGIAMNTLLHGAMKRPQITEKKSVFTIAYDDVHTKQIRADSDSPQY